MVVLIVVLVTIFAGSMLGLSIYFGKNAVKQKQFADQRKAEVAEAIRQKEEIDAIRKKAEQEMGRQKAEAEKHKLEANRQTVKHNAINVSWPAQIGDTVCLIRLKNQRFEGQVGTVIGFNSERKRFLIQLHLTTPKLICGCNLHVQPKVYPPLTFSNIQFLTKGSEYFQRLEDVMAQRQDLDPLFVSEALKQCSNCIRVGCRDMGLLKKVKRHLEHYLSLEPQERYAVVVKIELALIESFFENTNRAEELLLDCFEKPFGNIVKIAADLVFAFSRREDFKRCFEIQVQVNACIEAKSWECHNNIYDWYRNWFQVLKASMEYDTSALQSTMKIKECWECFHILKKGGEDTRLIEIDILEGMGRYELALQKVEEVEATYVRLSAQPREIGALYQQKAVLFVRLNDRKNARRCVKLMKKFGVPRTAS